MKKGVSLSRVLEKCTCSVHFFPCLFLLATNLWLFCPYLFTRRIIHGSGTDIVSFQYPLLSFIRRSLLSGEFPLWNPHIFTGQPLFAMGQGGIAYPLNYLFMLLGAFSWIKTSFAFHHLVSMLGGYALALLVLQPSKAEQRPASIAALVSGLAVGCGGFFFLHLYAGHLNLIASYAWMPVILALLAKAITTGTFNWLIGAGVTIALQITAGGTQIVIVTALAMLPVCTLFIARGIRLRRDKCYFLLRSLGRIGVIWVVGLGLSAVQLVPMLELAQQSARGAGGEPGSFALPACALLLSISPNYFGDPAGSFWSTFSRWEYGWYLGAPVLIAVVYGVLRRPKLVLGLTVSSCLFLAMAMDVSLVSDFVKLILPLVKFFRVPARFISVAALFLALGASVGLYEFLTLSSNRKGTKPSSTNKMQKLILSRLIQSWRKVTYGLKSTTFAVYLCVFALGLLWISFLHVSDQTAFGEFFKQYARAYSPIKLKEAGLLISKDLLLELFFALLTAVLITLCSEYKFRFMAARLFVLIVAVGLVMRAQHLINSGSTAEYFLPKHAEELLKNLPSNSRVLMFEQRSWNKGMIYGYKNAGGYDPSITWNYNRFINRVSGRRGKGLDKVWALWPTHRTQPSKRLLAAAAVSTVITRTPQRFIKAGLKLERSNKGWYRLSVEQSTRVLNIPQEIVRATHGCDDPLFSNRTFDPKKTAVVCSNYPSKTGANGTGVAYVLEWKATQLIAKVKLNSQALLVASILSYPGWKCEVDGTTQKETYPVNLVGQGCIVPEGEHIVRFFFYPVTFYAGFVLTLLTTLLLLGYRLALLIVRRESCKT